jgi:multidrug resistance efflux pump
MKRLIIFFCLIFFGLTACNGNESVTPTPSPEDNQAIQATQTTSAGISANGILMPINQMDLSFGVGGSVETVTVEVGEQVSAGQVLARLDPSEVSLAVQQAEAELATTQANYNLVAAGSSDEQRQAAIAASTMELVAAQQALDALYDNANLAAAQALQSVVDAQEAIDDSLSHLNSLSSDAAQTHIDAAYANMVLAKADLDRAQDAYDPWKNKSENNVTRARLLSKLAQAQQDYDAAVRKYNSLFGSVNDIDLTQAEADLVLAQAQLADAQRAYNTIQDGPDPDEVALAEARVANAQAQVVLAEAGGPTPEELALAQAQVDSAQSNLEIIRAQMDVMTVTAPFDGIISSAPISQGEWAVAGETVVEIIDVSRWRIETKNVGELQIGGVEIGGAAQVRVNAFRDQTLLGHIAGISPIAVVQQGDTTYTLFIELENTDLNLWPGMTAQVEILDADSP